MKPITLTRWEDNPLLTPIRIREHWWESGSVFNAGVVKRDSKIFVLYRALGSLHYSHFGLAVLKDPFTIEKRFSFPVLAPEEGNPYERFGVEDPRVVFMKDRYWITYTAASVYPYRGEIPETWGRMGVPWRLRCSLVTTRDFIHYQRRAAVLPGMNTKDGTLFPEKINGQYYMLHRIFPDIWITSSEGINRFPRGKVLCSIRKRRWDNSRIGAGAPPIKTPLGWLEFYHGVDEVSPGRLVYKLGILLLDLNDPTKILYRSPEPILTPEEDYEKKGYVDDVVFTCGAILWKKKYYVYYGAADRCIGVAYISQRKLLDALSANIGTK